MQELAKALSDHALIPLGHRVADGTTTVLIGPDEPAFWPLFSQSPEYRDGAPDPLDRWSRRVIDEVAAAQGGEALYPFGGPPYHPFYSWAL
ncbi:MAG: ferredoxin, partial [Pseudomonadota bacterium]